MREILVIGDDCAAKNFVLIALHPFFKLVDLQPFVSLSGFIDPTIIYVCDQPETALIFHLRKIALTLILVAPAIYRESEAHFFIEDDFPSLSDKNFCSALRAFRLYINNHFAALANLTPAQRLVFNQLVGGKTIKQGIADAQMSRALFFKTLAQLRYIFGADSNCELAVLFSASRSP
jgi:hypothetical protein